MDKNIYDLLNDVKTDADEQLENNEFEELSEFETKKIMSHITGSDKTNKKSDKKKYIAIAIGFAAAAALAVSMWAWRGTNNNNNDPSGNIVASNDPTTEEVTTEIQEVEDKTTEENGTVEDKTTEDAGTVEDKTTEDAGTVEDKTTEDAGTTEEKTTEEASPTIEKRDFNIVCAYQKTPEGTSEGDKKTDDNFNVSIWDGRGTSGDLCWTNMMFTINGDNISSVHVSLDKCELYTQTPTDININDYMYGYFDQTQAGYGEMSDTRCLTPFIPFGVCESVDLAEVVGNDFSADYVPGRKYGFYIPDESIKEVITPEEVEMGSFDWSGYDQIVDLIRNAKLTVEVTYDDGAVVTKVYNVHPGNLKYYISESGYAVATTEFAGEGEDSVYGIVLEEIK